jgi:hypothetical protein
MSRRRIRDAIPRVIADDALIRGMTSTGLRAHQIDITFRSRLSEERSSTTLMHHLTCDIEGVAFPDLARVVPVVVRHSGETQSPAPRTRTMRSRS